VDITLKIELTTSLNHKPLLHIMAAPVAAPSYAAIASSTVVGPNYSRGVVTDIQKEITQILEILEASGPAPDALLRMVDGLRNDMEIPATSRGGNRFNGNTGGRSFTQGAPSNWRGGRFQGQGQGQGQGQSQGQGQGQPFDTRNHESFGSRSSPSTTSVRPTGGRYQSKFTTGGDINDKILNSVIGNKLNSFTPLTYNDTRDFIYQIMDSGETEFIKDFVEKVFAKATLEELYCALFAKLIAEIAHRYPVMYEEMRKYHEQFLKIFEDVSEGGVDSDTIKQRQYRLGYGQFISELASLNALEKEQLLAMVEKVMEKIWILTEQEDKTKMVEEFIDCIFRLTKSLREKSPTFFASVKDEMKVRIVERANGLIGKSVGPRPSLSVKARFGLMDLKDIL
jgi:hypothetical protein